MDVGLGYIMNHISVFPPLLRLVQVNVIPDAKGKNDAASSYLTSCRKSKPLTS